MGQRSGRGYIPLSLLHIHLKIFKRSQHSTLCALTTHHCTKHILLVFLQPVLPLGLEIHTAAASWRSHENSSHQLPPYPDNHYISVREESINAAEINKPACFLFQSEDKGGVCSAEQNSQTLQGGQEKLWVFLILVWTKYLDKDWAQEYFQKFKIWKAEEKILSALHLFSNTAPLETKGTGRRG